MKLVMAITNHKNRSNNDNTNSPIFTYQIKKYVIFSNNGDNPKYFINFFPTFFFFSIRNHLSLINSHKKEKIQFEAWNKWISLHHLRR